MPQPVSLQQGFFKALANNALVKAAWRTFEATVVTTLIMSLTTFLVGLSPSLTSFTALKAYDWHTAIGALLVGILAGIVTGFITFLNLLRQYIDGTNAPINPSTAP